MYWKEIEYVLDLTYNREDYENSELRTKYSFLGGAVLQYAWVTQNCAKRLDRRHILKIFEKMINKNYEDVERGHIKVDDILNYCKATRKEFKVFEELQSKIRGARTFDKFEQVLDEFSERIQEDLKANKRVSEMLAFGLILFEDYCSLCNDEVIECLSKYLEHFSRIQQYDYLSDGMPIVKSFSHRDMLLAKFSRKRREHLLTLEKLARDCFYSGEVFKDKINNKDRQLLREYSYMSISLVASRFKKEEFKELSKLTIEAAEKETIEKLEKVAPLYDLVDEAMYNCALEILSEDVPKEYIKEPEELMEINCKRILNSAKKELNEVTDILFDILNINVNLGKQLSHLTLLANNHNCEKYAKVLRGHGIDMAKYWVNSVIDEIGDRLEFYTEYTNRLLVNKLMDLVGNENLSIKQPSEAKIRKSLAYIGEFKELNRIAGNKGFTKVRQKGDHGVFRRYDGSTVIIPQGREIGKGLSIKIQKDLSREETFRYE